MTKPNTFTDATGHRWPITISLATVRAVKSTHDIDLTRFAIDSSVLTAFEDPCRFSEILGTILEADLTRESLTQHDLERSLSGDAINDAIFATVRAIRDFLPEAPRQIASKVVDRMEHAARNQIDLATKAARSGALDVAYDAAMRQVEEDLDRVLATQQTASPAPQ